MQGAGVNTPDAALVAAWTAGFKVLKQMPKVAMFVVGTKSVAVASGTPAGRPAEVRPGETVNTLGDAPNEQARLARLLTSLGMSGARAHHHGRYFETAFLAASTLFATPLAIASYFSTT